MIELSRFQRELLKFFQFFLEEEDRPPRLQEICHRFGLSEDSARIHIGKLKNNGLLLPRETESSFQRLGPWAHLKNTTQVPLLGTICAGLPETGLLETDQFIPIPLKQLGIHPSEHIFALEVRGDSMIGKHIVEGDFVILNKAKHALHGNVVAALVDNQTTLKTYYEQDGKQFLRAENPAYQDIVPVEELQIQGVMIYLLRKTG